MNQSTLIDESIHGDRVDPQSGHQQLDDGPLRLLDLRGAGRQTAVDPAGEDLLERAVQDPRREACVDLGAELTPFLTARDDPFQGGERVLDLVDLTPEL